MAVDVVRNWSGRRLAAGRYALFCNILETEADGAKENHYANGMRARFEVRG